MAVSVHFGLFLLSRIGGPRVLWGDEKAYLGSARLVLQGDSSWWPVPLWPPLYPRFLAGILAVFDGGYLAITVVQTALLFIAALIFQDLTRRWTGSRTAGVAGFLLMAAFPSLAAFGQFFWPEILHLTLALAALWILVVRRDSCWWLAIAGISLGMALLTKSLLGPCIPVLLGVAFFGDRDPRRFLRPAVVVGAIIVVIGPVIGLQYSRTGSAMIADSSAFNLWVGLNDRGMKSFEDPVVAVAYREYLSWDGTFAERNARLHRQSLELIRERGVGPVVWSQFRRQYRRLFDKDCYLTELLPGGAGEDEGAGFTSLGSTEATLIRFWTYGAYALLLLTAPLGFLVWPFPRSRWPRLLLLFLAYNLALFLFLHVKSRYRVQILPVFFLGSAGAVAWLEAGLTGRFTLGDFKGRIAIAAAISGVLAWLAF